MRRQCKRQQRGQSTRSREEELFREASSLSVTTGAHVAVITVAPDGVARSHGLPLPGSVVRRYVRSNPPTSDAPSRSMLDELCRKYMEQRRTEEEVGEEGSTAEESELKKLELSVECMKKLREDLLKRASSRSSPNPSSSRFLASNAMREVLFPLCKE